MESREYLDLREREGQLEEYLVVRGLARVRVIPGNTWTSGREGGNWRQGRERTARRDGDNGASGNCGSQGDDWRQGHGDTGLPGPQGPTIGGAVYVRWGRTVCPSGQGTELVYSGRAGGSHYSHSGGGANHLCMSDDPEHLQYTSGVQGHGHIYGVEYRPHSQPLRSAHHHNVPCAVCHVTTRATLLMIPA